VRPVLLLQQRDVQTGGPADGRVHDSPIPADGQVRDSPIRAGGRGGAVLLVRRFPSRSPLHHPWWRRGAVRDGARDH